jgi:hypothetical protein
MSKSLASLLQQPEETITKAIHELEALNGHPSHDARLLAEISQKVRQKVSQLKLDPDDTTGEELYHSLLSRFKSDSQQLDKALGLEPGGDLNSRLAAATELIKHAEVVPERWALKQAVLCQIFRAHPPTKTMKALHYRSLESMLRRQDLSAVFIAAGYLESATWHKKISRIISQTQSNDFEMRQVRIVNLPEAVSSIGKGPVNGVINDEALAAVAVWPSEKMARASTLSLAAQLVEGLNKLDCQIPISDIVKLHPSLHWWRNNEHLINLHKDKPVSLNLLDIDKNYQNQALFGSHDSQAAQASLWQRLCSAYENQANILHDLSASDSKNKFKLPVAQMAPEYIQI